MLKWTVVIALLLGLVVLPATADDLLVELDDIVIRRVETSCLIGNVGAAVGTYWPVGRITHNVTVGPMGALGHEAIIGGLGIQLPVDITVMGLQMPVDFGFAGGFYDWVERKSGFASGVGKTFEMSF